jgi:hypothetical protein
MGKDMRRFYGRAGGNGSGERGSANRHGAALQPVEESPVQEIDRIGDIHAGIIVGLGRVRAGGAALAREHAAQIGNGVADDEQR